MTREEMLESARKVKEYCEEHHSDHTLRGCDCPFSIVFSNGYLCGAHGYPRELEEQNK